jgi:hypothetical protein
MEHQDPDAGLHLLEVLFDLSRVRRNMIAISHPKTQVEGRDMRSELPQCGTVREQDAKW